MRYDNREKSPGKRQSYLALLYDFTGKELTKILRSRCLTTHVLLYNRNGRNDGYATGLLWSLLELLESGYHKHICEQ